MSSGGSIAAMNSTLRNNRMLSKRRKERVKDVQAYFRDAVVKKRAFHGKEISPEEMAELKAEIRKMARKKALQQTVILYLSILFFLIGLASFYYFLY